METEQQDPKHKVFINLPVTIQEKKRIIWASKRKGTITCTSFIRSLVFAEVSRLILEFKEEKNELNKSTVLEN